ncbi:MAG: uncharacterized membrane protein (UPF0127 family) [Sediminicola sp.]|jgi:uncharacterized membrane protein (UPF0127 family)
MKKHIISAAIMAAIIVLGSCKEKKQKILTQEVIFKKEGELSLQKSANDSTIATLNIEIADDEYQTQTGLMYRKSMKDDQAMLFIFEDEIPRAFYMKNTQFALDIIFIDSDRKVVSIQKNAQSLDLTSLPSEGPAQYVLEVNAGLSDKWTLENGDRIEW